MKYRSKLLVAVSAIGVAAMSMPIAAQAQTAPAADEESSSDIIVTARRRAEALQDIPLAISAFTGETIERENLRRIDDLTRLSAGLTFDIGGFPNDTRPAMRGMQAERGRPSVAVLLDGHDLSGENISIAGGSAALRMNLFDLERIEVVKGPQATLYGRNAFAGAINYISRKPSFDFGGRVSLETGTGSVLGSTISITGPIIKDILAFRVNASGRRTDGYYTNPVNRGQLGAENSKGFAAALLLTPAEGLEITGRFQYSKDRSSDNATAFIPANTRLPVPGGTFAPPGPPGTPQVACPTSLVGVPASTFAACTRGAVIGEINAREQNVQMSINPLTGLPPFGMRMNSRLGTITAEWDTGSFGEFHYQFGYLKDHSLIEQDGDFSNTPAPPGLVLSLSVLQNLDYRNKHTDHTAYWTYDSDRFDLLLGVQRFDETSSLVNSSQFWLRSPTSALGGPPFNLRRVPVVNTAFPSLVDRVTDYTGFFGGASFEIVNGLRLSADVRYNKDKITYTSSGWRRQDVSLSQLTPVCLPALTPGATFSPSAPATSPPPGTVVACPQKQTVKDSRWTPRFTLEYRWNDDIMTYASYAEGFKPGGFNTNEVVTLVGQGYNAETVKTIEVGIKSSWLDDRLTANFDVYRNRYRDQQIGVQQTSVGAGGALVTTAGIINAARVNIWGMEADISWRIADPVTVTLGYAYTDSVFDNYVQGAAVGSPAAAFTACGVPQGRTASAQNLAEAGNICGDFSGNRVGKSAKHSLNGSLLWKEEVGAASVFGEISSSYRSKRFTDESNLAFLPSYWQFGLKTGAEIDGISISIFVDNLFDSKKIQSAQRNIDLGNPEGFAPGRAFIAYLPRPRTFGLKVGAEF